MNAKIEDLEIKKIYPASYILRIMENENSGIKIGHIVVIKGRIKTHEYHITKTDLKKLGELQIQILSFMKIPVQKNIANILLADLEIKDVLNQIKKDSTLACVITRKDLIKFDYKYDKPTNAINLLNRMFKVNKTNYKASTDPEGIKIQYKESKDELL